MDWLITSFADLHHNGTIQYYNGVRYGSSIRNMRLNIQKKINSFKIHIQEKDFKVSQYDVLTTVLLSTQIIC